MSNDGDTDVQIEPGGITYDRFRLSRVLRRIVAEHGIGRVVEVPASGEKAMPSIYSLPLGLMGCEVTLVNPSPSGLAAWESLGLMDRVTVVQAEDLARLPLEKGSFHLAWNFVTLSKTGRFEAVLAEMKRVSAKLVMTVHNNGFNLGYPWHRLIHRVFGFPWTHGDSRYHWPANVQRAYDQVGLERVALDVLDSPPWPDPPGFRDIRLHRQLADGQDVTACAWHAPAVDYFSRGRFPLWMRTLSVVEDLPGPRWMRYPFSHLFYALYRQRSHP